MKRIFIYFVTVFAILSCGKQRGIIEKMEEIKEIGNDRPDSALRMFDSICVIVRGENEYVQKKYDLLRIRLNDKANVAATSDILIRELVPYFENNGSEQEKQEAYYYAGSVYRDVKDTPKAIEFFQKAAECSDSSDVLMRRNIYTQLNDLYFKVQDYRNSLATAKKEYDYAKEKGILDALTTYHLAYSYLANDSNDIAIKYLDETLYNIRKSESGEDNKHILSWLLYSYSYCKRVEQADSCYELLKKNYKNNYSSSDYFALSEYHKLMGDNKTAMSYYEHILQENNDAIDQFEALRQLFLFYYHHSIFDKASEYANQLVHLSDSIDFGKRQELAATINNQFQYHRDQEREQRLKDENTRYHLIVWTVSVVAVFLFLAALIYSICRKNRHLKQLLKLTSELEETKKNVSQIVMQIDETRKTIEQHKQEKKEMEAMLSKADAEKKLLEQDLVEREKQNKDLMKMLHEKELSTNSMEIVEKIKKSSNGYHHMKDEEWDELLVAIDDLYPTFRDVLISNIGKVTNERIRVCYLMKIGLTSSQIQNTINVPRSTVFRWISEYKKLLGDIISPHK